MSTGLPQQDAQSDFARERRRRALRGSPRACASSPTTSRRCSRSRRSSRRSGAAGERDLGIQTIPLDSIVGTVDRRDGEFDREFRPASPQLRGRWERIAAARRRGEAMPPIDVYRIGELHFVQDGHHRVSVARALGDTTIEAHVREVETELGAGRELRLRDLPLKQHERVFHERVPLPPEARARIKLSDEWRYAQLATLVEAWGFRASHAREQLLSREEMARAWFTRGVRAGRRGAGARRASAARAPRPSATCASRCCASCCSTRTTGTTTSSSGCSARRARPASRTTRWSTRSSRRCAERPRPRRGPVGRGLAVRVGAAVEPGDPGRFHALFGRDSLITALQVLPGAPDVARATLRALAGLQGTRTTRDARGAGEDRARVPRRAAGRRDALRRPRVAGRRAPLLRHRRRDVVVPRRARGARRPRARGRAARRGGARPRGCAARSSAAAGSCAGGRAGLGGGLAQQGWRDADDAGGRDGGGILRADGTVPPPPLADADTQAAAVAALRALAALSGSGVHAGAARTRRAARRALRAGGDGARRRGLPVRGAGSQLGWLLWAGVPDAPAPPSGWRSPTS